MTVKELRDYLYKCEDNLIIKDCNCEDFTDLIVHKDIVNDENSWVELF